MNSHLPQGAEPTPGEEKLSLSDLERHARKGLITKREILALIDVARAAQYWLDAVDGDDPVGESMAIAGLRHHLSLAVPMETK